MKNAPLICVIIPIAIVYIFYLVVICERLAYFSGFLGQGRAMSLIISWLSDLFLEFIIKKYTRDLAKNLS